MLRSDPRQTPQSGGNHHDGRWLIAGEREYPGEEPSSRDRLKELDWLLGDWVDSSDDAVIHTSCRYSPDHQITWQGEIHFLFKLAGSGPEDPGLAFTR